MLSRCRQQVMGKAAATLSSSRSQVLGSSCNVVPGRDVAAAADRRWRGSSSKQEMLSNCLSHLPSSIYNLMT